MTAVPTQPEYRLADRYVAEHGTVYLTGLQCLLRAVIDHQRYQIAHGKSYGALVSGYPGSPLASFDKEFERIHELAESLNVIHQQAVNEEIAATALAGSQLAAAHSQATVDGVIGMWYGKAPGVERAHDAFKHANFVGAATNGGVIVAAGDDPTCSSSTVPSASENTLADVFMPVLYPGSPQDVIELSMIGLAMSRYCGLWVAVKMVSSVAEAAGDVVVDDHRFSVERAMSAVPVSRTMTGSLLPPTSVGVEQEIISIRLPAALEFARLNHLNPIFGVPNGEPARIAIVAGGRQYFDTRSALRDLGFVTNDDLAHAGIRLGKLDMIWPVDPDFVRRVAHDAAEVIVIEEKHDSVESQLISALYRASMHPTVIGKKGFDQPDGFEAYGGISVADITNLLGVRFAHVGIHFTREAGARISALSAHGARNLIPLSVQREPWFCSGCPHNTSTVVPEGSLVGAGIGCHAMVMWMDPQRMGEIIGVTQMGGEGANWVGMAPFVAPDHIFQNLGDGTFFHSGHLAIRAAIAAGVNITYKLLYNSAVAMTGGQAATGSKTVPEVCSLMLAEGVKRIVITTEEVNRYRGVTLPNGVAVRHRDELDAVQRSLAATPGVTMLIHDQQCAAEKRRLRKRGKATTPRHKIVINQRICEGCGDCMVQSNCLSLETVQTQFGPKTVIDQASCNIDESCVRGDCPSFMEVIPGDTEVIPGATAVIPGATKGAQPTMPSGVPEPTYRVNTEYCSLRMVGVGGTGVVTLNQILGTAAMLDGRHVSGLDQTGLAQKGGPVISDLIVSSSEFTPGSRIGSGTADVLLVCDPMAGASARTLDVAQTGHTIACMTTAASPAGRMLIDRDLTMPSVAEMQDVIGAATAADLLIAIDAEAVAVAHGLTSAVANVVLLGFAFQSGLIPLSASSVERAIAVNGASVPANLAAFGWGRAVAHDPTLAPAPTPTEVPVDFALELADYQSPRYAKKWRTVTSAAESADPTLGAAVAANLFKLMAYKDEYEVARLALHPSSKAAIIKEFGVGAKVAYRLHPPALRALGMTSKLRLRHSAPVAFWVLRSGRHLRGTPLDVFGYARVRRTERALIDEYVELVSALGNAFGEFTDSQRQLAVRIASLPAMIRGYEHVKLGNVELYRSELAALQGELANGAHHLETV